VEGKEWTVHVRPTKKIGKQEPLTKGIKMVDRSMQVPKRTWPLWMNWYAY